MDQLNKIVKILGTPDKNDWPEGYKMAQAKGINLINSRLLFSRWERGESSRNNSSSVHLSSGSNLIYVKILFT